MSLFDVLRTALSSLGANKLRAGLTLLGIVIGVTAVISLMSIGRGAQESITSRIESLGTNLLFVRPGETSQGGIFGGQGSASTLTLEDAYALVDPVLAPSVAAVAPEISTSGQVVAAGQNTFTRVIGVTPEYQFVRNFPVGSGQFISAAHVRNISEVAVLGSQVAETLYGFRDPVGQTLRISGRQFTVVGVLERQGGNALGIFDDQILIPITTVYYRLASQRTTQGGISVQTINVQAQSVGIMDETINEIATVLRLRHRITDADDFNITSQEETIATLEETTNTFVVFLGAIAGPQMDHQDPALALTHIQQAFPMQEDAAIGIVWLEIEVEGESERQIRVAAAADRDRSSCTQVGTRAEAPSGLETRRPAGGDPLPLAEAGFEGGFHGAAEDVALEPLHSFLLGGLHHHHHRI